MHEGYIYVFKKYLAYEVQSYECIAREKGQCNAQTKINLDNDKIGSFNEHMDPPFAVIVETLKKMYKLL